METIKLESLSNFKSQGDYEVYNNFGGTAEITVTQDNSGYSDNSTSSDTSTFADTSTSYDISDTYDTSDNHD